ncbi:aldose epimerase [Roseomonas sp. CCTCC AB2023176]|uniref:aldose epimerase family protein n=1 Tax=Roseomonas sp. CCTCC AB2023176 TaxID=3342640 RepID=UPI0035DE91F8
MRLSGGGWTAGILPDRGAAMARLTCDGRDVLVPLPDGADPNATWAGAFLMLPWTNRLDEGRLPYPGGEHRFPINRPVEGTALHGLGREAAWDVGDVSAARAVLHQRYAAHGQPYRYAARLTVTLGDDVTLRLDVTNDGEDGTPFGTGWHPFFTRPEGTRLSFRATGAVSRDTRNLPVAVEPSDGVDGAEEAISGRDTHYVGWDGTAHMTLGDAGYVLQAGGAWARNLQLFAPGAAGILCVEPVSHVPDVINRRAFAGYGDMTRLPRGGTITGEVTLRRG